MHHTEKQEASEGGAYLNFLKCVASKGLIRFTHCGPDRPDHYLHSSTRQLRRTVVGATKQRVGIGLSQIIQCKVQDSTNGRVLESAALSDFCHAKAPFIPFRPRCPCTDKPALMGSDDGG
jgi:hypothetical protein